MSSLICLLACYESNFFFLCIYHNFLLTDCSYHSWMDLWCYVPWFAKYGGKQICTWGKIAFISLKSNYHVIHFLNEIELASKICFYHKMDARQPNIVHAWIVGALLYMSLSPFRFQAEQDQPLKRRKFFWRIMIPSGLSCVMRILQMWVFFFSLDYFKFSW